MHSDAHCAAAVCGWRSGCVGREGVEGLCDDAVFREVLYGLGRTGGNCDGRADGDSGDGWVPRGEVQDRLVLGVVLGTQFCVVGVWIGLVLAACGAGTLYWLSAGPVDSGLLQDGGVAAGWRRRRANCINTAVHLFVSLRLPTGVTDEVRAVWSKPNQRVCC